MRHPSTPHESLLPGVKLKAEGRGRDHRRLGSEHESTASLQSAGITHQRHSYRGFRAERARPRSFLPRLLATAKVGRQTSRPGGTVDISGIDHIAFLTSDVDRLTAFYEELFGARRVVELPIPEPLTRSEPLSAPLLVDQADRSLSRPRPNVL